jgi:hypothetical protein
MILKRTSKQDRRRRQRQLLNTGVQVFTDSAHVDALGINLSDVGMRLFAVANLPLGSQIQVEFLPPDAQNGFEFVGSFAIALCIFTESSFWWTQINNEIVGPMSARLRTVRPLSLSELATDPEQQSITVAKSPLRSEPLNERNRLVTTVVAFVFGAYRLDAMRGLAAVM